MSKQERLKMDTSSATGAMRVSDRDETMRRVVLQCACRGDFSDARTFARQITSDDLRREVLDAIGCTEDAVAAHG